MPVIDRKAGYSFVCPFGWQEVSVQGQDKVYEDVIEPLESVSINMTPATKEDIRNLSPPDPAVREWTSRLLCTTPMTSSTTSANPDSPPLLHCSQGLRLDGPAAVFLRLIILLLSDLLCSA
ncbi:psbP-like protein 1, chloroplastic [Triticum aestivum]|uniref:psbP-like protein 1, chloroplastic n=1 Tax=Triticum aestivum TaxID=4565 RepID=UPI001D0266B9|nr:psbP-like protein 1, chloroplastic [Triticum aestivum]